MRNWQRYWNHDRQVRQSEPLKQVGKTVGGVPIGSGQLAAIVTDIVESLALSPSDRVLDLCCGNGVLTQGVAASCRTITGIDFSGPLLEVARSTYAGPNIRYELADVTAIPGHLMACQWDKAFMYEALQHLEPDTAERVFEQLAAQENPVSRLYLGSVPDRDRIWNFYDTEARRLEYERRVAEGTEAIGYWWRTGELTELAKKHGFATRIRPESAAQHVSHYRFDAVCIRDGAVKGS